MLKLDVALLPRNIPDMDLSNTTCIILDVFRATTSIVTAMANGCKTITPVLSIEDAYHHADQVEAALFAGERQSIKIERFDFGNSPFEFSADKVKGQNIIMTTTNGTIAIKAPVGACRTLIGSFINAGAVCDVAKQAGTDVLIVCAGTDGLFSLEDTLCAGLLVKRLSDGGRADVIMTDSAQGALLMYNAAEPFITEVAISSRNGKRLAGMGLQTDVEYCLQADMVNIVPEYRAGRIVSSKELSYRDGMDG